MKTATAAAVFVMALLAAGFLLNADLLLRRFPLNTGFGTVSAPLILCLVLFAGGSWMLFLLVTSVRHGILVRNLEGLSVASDEKDRELMRVKAACLDEAVQSLRHAAGRLDHRLWELEPVLAVRRGDAGSGPASANAVPPDLAAPLQDRPGGAGVLKARLPGKPGPGGMKSVWQQRREQTGATGLTWPRSADEEAG
jgi:hypothetical protein